MFGAFEVSTLRGEATVGDFHSQQTVFPRRRDNPVASSSSSFFSSTAPAFPAPHSFTSPSATAASPAAAPAAGELALQPRHHSRSVLRRSVRRSRW